MIEISFSGTYDGNNKVDFITLRGTKEMFRAIAKKIKKELK